MKKIISILMFCLPFWAFGQTTLVTWNFPNSPDDSIADGGTPANLGMYITTYGGTSARSFSTGGVTTNCASATKWNSGNGTKYWQIKVVTLGYSNILLSSKQYSSSTGPRNFKAQYSADYSATWNDFAGNAITVATNWSTGKLTNVALPAACNNLDTVFVRWIMTTDTAVSGAVVGSTGSSKIDDIIIAGQSISVNPAVKLSIVSVNGGADPFVNAPFDVIVNSLDSNNNVANVSTGTNVLLSLVTGTGSLGGTLSGLIAAGSSSGTVSGVTYNTAESGVSIKASDQASVLIPDTSGPFTVLQTIPQNYCDSLLSDNFSDGDFSINPVWSGDTSKFIVDTSPSWLQLSDVGTAGTSCLSTGNNITISQDTIIWDFLTQINYNTSSSNNARFYLMCDSANLKSTLLNGYFIQLGGTHDSIALHKQTGSTDTILIHDKFVYTGTSNNLFRVKVMKKCSNNEWTLYSDPSGGTNYVSSGSAIDGSYLPSSLFPYLGVYCKYTSTTGNKYFFGDINVHKCGGCCLPPLISNYNLQATVNATLQLFANSIPIATYVWSGPDGFSSNLQNPVVSNNATMSMSGIYYVTATVSGCGTIVDSVDVTVLNEYCDNFSDGDFTHNFTWTDLNGDTNFIVSPNFELQSNGPHSNGSTAPDDIILVTQSPFTTLDSAGWSFLVDLRFNPTSDNWARIYLVSDQQDINGSVNGYYIQIGQTGSDSIKFYREDAGTSTLLFTGSTSFSDNVLVRIKVWRDYINNYWIIESDPIGGFNYMFEGSPFPDNTFITTSYFGVYCHYKTDSRYNEYYFDDICMGKGIVGIEENTGNKGISIYPNPAYNKLNIEITSSLAGKDNLVSIYNIQGQLMCQQSLQNVKSEINISSFPDGIYFIRITNSDNTSIVRKFIKN